MIPSQYNLWRPAMIPWKIGWLWISSSVLPNLQCRRSDQSPARYPLMVLSFNFLPPRWPTNAASPLTWAENSFFPNKQTVFGIAVWWSCVCFLYTISQAIPEQSSGHLFGTYFCIPAFKGFPNVIFAVCIKGYLTVILVNWPRDNISAKEFCLVEIQCACTSILCSAKRIAILRNGCIAYSFIEFFCSQFVTAKLLQKIYRSEPLKVSILAPAWLKASVAAQVAGFVPLPWRR